MTNDTGKGYQPALTEADILKLLKARHSKDVFVAHCKNGPTWNADGMHVMDAWTMSRSWSKPRIVVYEIKSTRGDFARDTKWYNYLPFCNELFFVCPWKLIQPEQVPDQVGLVWVSRTGSRLFTKRKAPYREPQIPDELWRYVVMRSVGFEQERRDMPDRAYWADWLRQKKIDHEFAFNVRGSIRETVQEKILDVQKRQAALEARMKTYDAVRAVIARLGIEEEDALGEWDLERRTKQAIEALERDLPKDLEKTIGTAIDALRQAHRALQEQISARSQADGKNTD